MTLSVEITNFHSIKFHHHEILLTQRTEDNGMQKAEEMAGLNKRNIVPAQIVCTDYVLTKAKIEEKYKTIFSILALF